MPLRWHARALIAAGTAAAIVITTAGSAYAVPPHFINLPRVQVGYTDSAAPDQAFAPSIPQPLLLGTQVDADGVSHTSRVYATFTVTGLVGARFIQAKLFANGVGAADCSKLAIEVWQTEAIAANPTWNAAPAEVARLDGKSTPFATCPQESFSFDVGAAVARALKKQQPNVTFELRVPAALEADPSYAHALSGFSQVSVSAGYNHVPTLDNQSLTNGGFLCGKADHPQPIGRGGPVPQTLTAIAADTDQDQLSYDFAVWPTADPSAVTHVKSTSGGVRIPDGVLVDGVTYAWNVQVTDGLDTSKTSTTCYVTFDAVAPTAPTVTSPNYPPYPEPAPPAGAPGTFVFSANGVTDVVGFEYSFDGADTRSTPRCVVVDGETQCIKLIGGPLTVKLTEPGGAATVRLSSPDGNFSHLNVRAVDAAGNRSPDTVYQFNAPDASPIITLDPPAPAVNQQATLTFAPAPGVKKVVGWDYRLFGTDFIHLDPAADGTAQVTFTVPDGGFQVTARSTSQNGLVSQDRSFFYFVHICQCPGVSSDVYLNDGQPHGGVGVPGTFTFTPPPNFPTAQYLYGFAGEDSVFVDAGPDGSATITWSPTSSGDNVLSVFAVGPDGSFSEEENDYSFTVA